MYCVSGCEIIGEAAISSAVSSARRHAIGLRAPLRNDFSAIVASTPGFMPWSWR